MIVGFKAIEVRAQRSQPGLVVGLTQLFNKSLRHCRVGIVKPTERSSAYDIGRSRLPQSRLCSEPPPSSGDNSSSFSRIDRTVLDGD